MGKDCRIAAWTVLAINIATVMGPTPPGTGVIALATCLTSSNATSPTSFWPLFFEASGTALIPQSMTTAPGLTQSFLTSSGTPQATTKMSACLAMAATSLVLEWAMVTVALFHNNNWAMGDPTIFDLPIITAWAPMMVAPARLISSKHPYGVQGRKQFEPSICPWSSFPAFKSDSLTGRKSLEWKALLRGCKLTHRHLYPERQDWLSCQCWCVVPTRVAVERLCHGWKCLCSELWSSRSTNQSTNINIRVIHSNKERESNLGYNCSPLLP